MASGYEMVVAIDFGTAYSGYAYAYKYEKDKIYVNTNWSSGSTMWQVPTAILFNNDKEVVAFGDDAETMYADYKMCEEEHSYHFFHRFKMMLHGEKSISNDLQFTAANGKKMSALTVISGAIAYLKDHFMGRLKERNSQSCITEHNIRWVLTVPAIWSDAAKQLMRRAAVLANIPASRLLIALEPECASIYVLTVVDSHLDARTGTRYTLLDCGGTVDTTVHEVIREGYVKELYKASGGDWGSVYVDKLFEEFLNEVFSKRVIDALKLAHPTDWVEMLRDFDAIKRSMNKRNKVVALFTITQGLSEVFVKTKGVSLSEGIGTLAKSKGIKLRGNRRLEIPVQIIRDWIVKVSVKIKQHVKSINQSVGEIDYIVMVGGFSNSSDLIDEIKKSAGDVPVFVPEEPEIAVVKGAVMFGWNENAIQVRRSKMTYGHALSPLFVTGQHPERLKYISADGEIRCNNIFDTLVTVNEEIQIGQKISRVHNPVCKNQKSICFRIYASHRKHLAYCDEEGVIKIGELTIPMPDVSGGANRKVDVDFLFGLTELTVKGFDRTSKSKVDCTLEFMTE